MSGRIQATHIDGVLSDVASVRVGVPQGSVLGPLLFTIYINSFPTSITVPQCKINMYADDTILMFTGTSSTFIKDMTTGLEQVSKWLHEHKLTLNVSKTKFMLLGTCRRLSEW